ncbi:MAG: AzlD domain-containing protein [Alphaproteobacteria bacterium]|nr:AzlD domain-containing protein [Alphaproteobacteria bacterium]MDX5415243.1 AzlD domain-containing protein [Alphaproteobacteria bacterium]MDX5492452.1 AzlD domain-containing protein [Alphaproteobacteria bacterium]
MDKQTVWLAIIAIGIGTFALRASFIELGGRFALPAPVTRALRFLPAAVLSAIILPAILRGTEGGLNFGIDNPRLIAGFAAALVAWKTKSVLATLAAGMGTLWAMQALI